MQFVIDRGLSAHVNMCWHLLLEHVPAVERVELDLVTDEYEETYLQVLVHTPCGDDAFVARWSAMVPGWVDSLFSFDYRS